MSRRECYHCKQWVEDGEEHDCWTTTEAALTQELTDDLRDAWERLCETAARMPHLARLWACSYVPDKCILIALPPPKR